MSSDPAPLLAPGRHGLSLSELHSVSVTAFPSSKSRQSLFDALSNLEATLSNSGEYFEIWIDGSFLTEKEEPNDIDITVIFPFSRFEKLDNNTANLLVLLGNQSFDVLIDSYVCDAEDAQNCAYWGRQWGSGRDESLKGYVILKVSDTDVGIRLFS